MSATRQPSPGWRRAAARQLAHCHEALFTGHGTQLYTVLAPWLLGDLYQRAAADAAQHADAHVVLDVGCGPGHLVRAIATRRPGRLVCGIDRSPDMIRQAMTTGARPDRAAGATFAVADGAQLPYAAASIDLAMATMSMHHWADIAHTMAELARVVRPGGQVWLYDVWHPALWKQVAASAAALPFTAPNLSRVARRWTLLPGTVVVRGQLTRMAAGPSHTARGQAASGGRTAGPPQRLRFQRRHGQQDGTA